jgi:linoleoyl-CoA desaturase
MPHAGATPSLHFARSGALHARLKGAAHAALSRRGLPSHGGTQIVFKAAFILALLVGSYLALVFWAQAWWEVALTAFLLSQAIVLVGFNVMHDGAHASFSSRGWVNRLAGRSLDLIGGSATLWRIKHGVLHHSYTNLVGFDDDLDTKGLLRLHTSQPLRPHHRYQVLYALPVYSLLSIHWVLSDFKEFVTGRVGNHIQRERHSTRDILLFVGFKLNFFILALGLPLALHPWQSALLVLLAIQLVVGFTTSLVFQLAHVVDLVDMPAPIPGTRRVAEDWAAHQLRTTADFAPGNRLVNWYCGGLNLQVEHHLFSRVSHVRYAHLRPVVQQICSEFGVRYRSYPTVFAAVRGHLRQLAALGRGASTVTPPATPPKPEIPGPRWSRGRELEVKLV